MGRAPPEEDRYSAGAICPGWARSDTFGSVDDERRAAIEKVLADLRELGMAPKVLEPLGRILRRGDPEDLRAIHLLSWNAGSRVELFLFDGRLPDHREDFL